jgi:hypothetical protein
MAEFVVGTPVVTREPVVTVDAGLRPGRHLFRLVVVDNDGQESAPDERIVTVSRLGGPTFPTEPTDPRDPRDPRIPTRPTEPTIPTRPTGPIPIR